MAVPGGLPSVHLLSAGYSRLEEGVMKANCSCVLIKGGGVNVIVDTMTAWDTDTVLAGLAEHQVTPDAVSFVVGTHGHSDHVGNLNLFTNAKHIVGFTICHRDTFDLHPFEHGESYHISPHIEVVPTPGHTAEHVSVLVTTQDRGIVAVAGDLFEKEEDIRQPRVWQDAGSEDQQLQKANRALLARRAQYIIPGHGPMFGMSAEYRRILQEQQEGVWVED